MNFASLIMAAFKLSYNCVMGRGHQLGGPFQCSAAGFFFFHFNFVFFLIPKMKNVSFLQVCNLGDKQEKNNMEDKVVVKTLSC